jgi:hypothetical protein
MPSTSIQQYDPTVPQQYQSVQLPDPQPAMPSPLPTQGPDINGAVKKSGAIATVADGILRGFMQGRAYHQAAEVMKLKKKTDDLQNSYNQDAVRLYQLTAAGVDPNSAEYKAAKSSVDGSWGALMDFYGQHIEQMTGEKKGKKKKTDQQLPPQAVLTNPASTPFEKAQAWYAVSKQAGPPVYGQVAMLNTKEAQAQRKAGELGAQNQVGLEETTARKIQAQKDYDELAGKPSEQLTDAQRTTLANAKAILYPPRQTGATRQYIGPNNERDWYLPGEAPEGWRAVPTGQGAPKLYTSPDKTKKEYYAPGAEPEGWQPYEKPGGGLKEGSFGAALNQKYGDHPTFEEYLKARREWAQASHFASAGGPGAEDKAYNKWHAYYKEHYPGMGDDELDSLTRRKVEGAGQLQAGQIGFDAATQPQQFDSDVIAQAIDNLRKMPQYGGTNPTIKYFDDAIANIVGLGDSGYQYHGHDNLGAPDSSGKFAGDVTQDQLKNLERDLQTQIRIILSKQTGLPPDQKRAAAQRMAPLFGPAATYGPNPAVPRSGNPPASPPAAAAPTRAPASSPAPSGELPPEAKRHLKAGQITTFGNGQQWTLDENGNPKQVK